MTNACNVAKRHFWANNESHEMKNCLTKSSAGVCCWGFSKQATMQPLNLPPAPLSRRELSHFDGALVFGTNYVWKSNRKYAFRFLTWLMKMDGWVAWMGLDTWQSIVSLHQCTGVSSIRSHISPGGNEDVPSNGKHNGCGQMEDISL